MTKTEKKEIKVLLVDDDISVIESIGRVMKSRFGMRGYDNIIVFTKHTKTALDAIRWMEEIRPMILLFDHNYGSEENGFDILKVAKNGLSEQIKKLIAITACPDAGAIYRQEYGIDWIKKSDYSIIIDAVIEFVENK